ncbi:MAG: type II secretion system F family protein [Candidatus Dormibacterales bacterium]
MPAILLGLIAAVGIFIFFLSLDRPAADKAGVLEQRLRGYDEPVTLEEQELQVPFTERILKPVLDIAGRFLAARTPDRTRQALQARLNLAGRPGGLTVSDFQAIRYGATVALFALGLAVGMIARNPTILAAGAAVGGGLGFFMPMLWLKQKADGRRKEIQISLPDAMDLLTISVEAGLSFDGAIQRLVDKYKNALTDEFSQVLKEVRLGRPRLDALEDMGARCAVEDLHNFVQAVVQSEQMGVGIAKILRIQSDEIRRKRRQRAQEKAAQATLKMMFPMVGCIFPSLWIVLLGPAVLILMHRGT